MSTTRKSSRKTSRTSAKRSTRSNSAVRSTARGKKAKKCAPPNRFLSGFIVLIIGVAATVFVTLLLTFALVGCFKAQGAHSDAKRFATEYTSVPLDNPFVYKNGQEVADIIEHGTGVVFLGFPSCAWCQSYAKFLSDVAKETGLKTINYFNIHDARQNNTEEYQKIVSLLGSNLQYDDNGTRRVYVPDVVFVVDGRIVGNDLESSKDTAGESDPKAYWTEDRVSELKSRLSSYAKQVVNAEGNCEDTCNN